MCSVPVQAAQKVQTPGAFEDDDQRKEVLRFFNVAGKKLSEEVRMFLFALYLTSRMHQPEWLINQKCLYQVALLTSSEMVREWARPFHLKTETPWGFPLTLQDTLVRHFDFSEADVGAYGLDNPVCPRVEVTEAELPLWMQPEAGKKLPPGEATCVPRAMDPEWYIRMAKHVIWERLPRLMEYMLQVFLGDDWERVGHTLPKDVENLCLPAINSVHVQRPCSRSHQLKRVGCDCFWESAG